MEYLYCFLDKNASALFGAVGAIFGFLGNYILQRLNRKHEITKEIAKEYFKEKSDVLRKATQLSINYQFKLETLHDFIEDENGIPIAELKKEDVYVKYFLLIFEYLHANRFYLEEDTIVKLDKLVDFYHAYKLDEKVIISERDKKDIADELKKLKEKLFQDTQVLFNGLKEQIKFKEIKNFKDKIGQD